MAQSSECFVGVFCDWDHKISILLYEKTFANLISSHKHFRGAIPGKQIRNFPILKNALRLEWAVCGYEFKVLTIQDLVAMKLSWFLGVEHGEDNAAIAQERSNAGRQPGHEFIIQIVKVVPHQNCVEGVVRKQHGCLQEFFRSAFH